MVTSDERHAFFGALRECLHPCENANRLWGEKAQRGMAVEEMGELLAALNQLERGRICKREVAEEIADVLITTLQLALSSIGIDNVTAALEEKRARLENKLAEGTFKAAAEKAAMTQEAEARVVNPRKGMIFVLEEKDWRGIWKHHVDWNEETWALAHDLDSGGDWTWSKQQWESALRDGEVTILEMGEDPPAAENVEDSEVESSEED